MHERIWYIYFVKYFKDVYEMYFLSLSININISDLIFLVFIFHIVEGK